MKKIRATRIVNIWVKPHKVKGYWKTIKKIVYISFREKKKQLSGGEGK